ncbi:MAG: MGMT family protein [Bacteroidales bacterium]|jgi:methylated-DNA-protein-cysteine methyltransferase-like protein|nr:MGMT family protein [Bacteroidales bacterium]
MKNTKKLKNAISDPLFRQESFFERVYEIVRLIPYGRVCTYGAIARFLGASSSARMVGWAMNQSHGIKPPVPAHRVVNRNGLLTGKAHFSSSDEMEQLLRSEGIEVENNQVKNFLTFFWDPNTELV